MTATSTTLDEKPSGKSTLSLNPGAKRLRQEGHDAELSGKTVNLTIPSSDGERGHEAVFVGVNGIGYHIPRDVPCEVPVEVAQVLDNAVQTTLHRVEGGALLERHNRRFNYQTAVAA